jgi:tetratricopeptide (TPR) repeat protein
LSGGNTQISDTGWAGDYEHFRGTSLADTTHNKGLALAKRGIDEDRRDLLEQASRAFEKAIEEAEARSTPANAVAFRCRAIPNLADVLRRLGRATEAATRLEEAQNSLKGASENLFDVSRVWDHLGSAYAAMAREKVRTAPERAAALRGDAIELHRRASTNLDRAILRGRAEYVQLHYRSLSNLAAVLIDDEQPDAARDAVEQALAILNAHPSDSFDWTLGRVRTERIHAQALSRIAEKGKLQDLDASINLYEQAIRILEQARDDLAKSKAPADWNQTTVLLSEVLRDLGALMVDPRSSLDSRKGARLLCHAVELFGEAFSHLVQTGRQETALENVRLTLQYLYRSPVEPFAVCSVFKTCREMLEMAGLPLKYKEILVDVTCIIIGVFRESLAFRNILEYVENEEQITALADFIASFGLPKTEAVTIVSAALERLGWSTHLVIDVEADRQSAATEVANRSAIRARVKWEDRRGDDLTLSPPEFIRRAYAAELSAGALNTGVIYREDPVLYKRLKRWMDSHEMPKDLDIPDSRTVRKQANTQKLEEVGPLTLGRLLTKLRKEGDPATRELIRLYELSTRRRQRDAARPVAKRPRSRKLTPT